MSFMQRQITNKREWYAIETTHGTFFVDKADAGNYPDGTMKTDSIAPEVQDAADDLSQYCEGEVLSWEIIVGHGARLSAPGYLDCTEWTVFDTVAQAEAYLDEYYPDDDESDDESDKVPA